MEKNKRKTTEEGSMAAPPSGKREALQIPMPDSDLFNFCCVLEERDAGNGMKPDYLVHWEGEPVGAATVVGWQRVLRDAWREQKGHNCRSEQPAEDQRPGWYQVKEIIGKCPKDEDSYHIHWEGHSRDEATCQPRTAALDQIWEAQQQRREEEEEEAEADRAARAAEEEAERYTSELAASARAAARAAEREEAEREEAEAERLVAYYRARAAARAEREKAEPDTPTLTVEALEDPELAGSAQWSLDVPAPDFTFTRSQRRRERPVRPSSPVGPFYPYLVGPPPTARRLFG